MIRSFITRLLSSARDDEDASPVTKRTHVRHVTADCFALIRGQNFQVTNWSFGGVEISANDGVFVPGQEVYMTMKFRLLTADLEVVHRGTVLRSLGQRAAIRFDDLKPHVSRGFQRVVDDSYARRRHKS